MHSGSRFLLWLLLFLTGVTAMVVLALGQPVNHYFREAVIRRQAVEITGLPDLALGHQAIWIRHRSLATPFAIFPEDGTLLEYYPGSFVYHLNPPCKPVASHEP